MAVKVIDRASKQVREVPAAEAQRGVQQGDYDLPTGRVKITKYGRVGTVDSTELLTSIANGASLVDDAEAAQIRMQREESTLGAQALGTLESAASSVTFGLSTAAQKALGMDPERMRARRESAGVAADAAGIVGAVLPALATGGSSVAARGLAAMPAGRAAAIAARAEVGLGRLGTGALTRRVIPMAAQGAIEGVGQGLGQALDESVLNQRDFGETAEAMLSGALYGGAFGLASGGAMGLTAASIARGASSVSSGLAAVPKTQVREVLRQMAGVADDGGDAALARIIASPQARQRIADANSIPRAEVDEIADDLLHRPDQLQRYLSDGDRVTEEVADELRGVVTEYREARHAAVMAGTGEGKYRAIERVLPTSSDDLLRIPQAADAKLAELEADIGYAITRAKMGRQMLNQPDALRTLEQVQIARKDIRDAARTSPGVDGARAVAAQSHQIVDGLKSQVDLLASRSRRTLQDRATQETTDLLSTAAGKLRSHLEDTHVYGAAGTLQAERNKLMTASLGALEDTRGTASGRLLSRDHDVTSADLLTTVRNSSRYAGATSTERFEQAIGHETNYLRWSLDNLDLTAAQRSAIERQLTAGARVSDAFAAQRAKVRKIEILKRWDAMTGSPTMASMAADAAPAVLGGVGFALGGPVAGGIGYGLGRAVRVASDQLHRPADMVRKMAAIRSHAARGRSPITKAMQAIAERTRAAAPGVRAAAITVGRHAVKATHQLADVLRIAGTTMASDAHERAAATAERVRTLATSPALLAGLVRGMTLDLDEYPQLSQAIGEAVVRKVHYLAKVAPRGYTPPGSKRTPIYDPIDLVAYQRRLEGALLPGVVAEHLANGTITAEHLEAMKAASPASYAALQEAVLEIVSTAQEIPPSIAASLSQVSPVPIDLMLQPAIRLAKQPKIEGDPATIAEGRRQGTLAIDEKRYTTTAGAARDRERT